MKIWHLTQSTVTGYDTYSDVVVAAESEDAARRIHPSEYSEGNWWERPDYCSGWPTNLVEISAKLIGEAVEGVEAGVICASFHAG